MSTKVGESLDDFCLKLSGLVSNIRALGEEMVESYVVKKVLRAMPMRFLQITSAIEQFGDLETMSVEELVGSLKAHDERLCGKNESTGGTGQLLLTEEEWRKRDKEESKLLLTREEWIKRSKRDKDQREEVNIAQVPDDEPALLLIESEEQEKNVLLINEEKINPRLDNNKATNTTVSNLWYLDNGASNHITRQKSKFKELNEDITG
ncbi:uncharacterized protein LOC141665661 [Apium graveolens]|uniref:uncharacterized protein LOC141665661 n=1 Tax=Apium graveolens TaxID=4045 RepID=UPI003D79AE2A